MKGGLGSYESSLVELACPEGEEQGNTERLFKVIREARNSAVHDGAYARHLSGRLIEFLVLIEQNLMNTMNRIEDLMVKDPVIAEPWHLIAHVRRLMLANSFSFLPYYNESTKAWSLLSDFSIYQHLSRGQPNAKKNELLSQTVEEAVTNSTCSAPAATTALPTDEISELKDKIKSTEPVLVVSDDKDSPNLLGLITAFDLL